MFELKYLPSTGEADPAGQISQESAPSTPMKLPAGHFSHAMFPVPTAILPAEQAVQVVEPRRWFNWFVGWFVEWLIG